MSAFFKNNRHGNSEESVSERNARYLIVFLLFVCFALLFSFVSRNNRFFSYAVDYIKAGDLVDQDITANATFDFVDRKRTEKNYDEIRQTTPRIYFTDDSKTFLVVADFSRIYSDSDPQNLRIRKILSDIYGRRYFELNDVFSDRSEYVVLDGQTLEKRDLLHSGTIDSYLRDNFGINETTKPSLSEIKMFIVPNVVYDYMATMQSISNLISNAPPVMVSYKRGDIIIARDEIVSEDQAELVREIRESENAVTAYGMIFKLSISFVMFFLAFYYIYELFKGNKLRRKQYYYFTCFAEFLYL
ncbi:MAG TPA: hypothetical protein DCO86_02325, partial [Spirochaetaceae bacterium]|nr:hypothetical protein [Spirochaetaceae bacterium]